MSNASPKSRRRYLQFSLRTLLILVTLAVGFVKTSAQETEPKRLPGNAVIRGQAGESDIVITTTSRVAGAIHSLRWNDKEFIDSFDHGRQMQSAANFDAGSPFTPETFNPTEAGSRADGRGGSSTSRLLHMVETSRSLQTTTQMAFWLRPGEKSNGRLAKNSQALSNHIVTKRVRIGYSNSRTRSSTTSRSACQLESSITTPNSRP